MPARVVEGLDAVVNRWRGPASAVARFMPGLRSIVFLSAGGRGVAPARFVIIDACAATVWVTLLLSVGASIVSLGVGELPPSFRVGMGASR
jgi:membrane protein DedA with SNARE-associated domain